MNILNAVGRSDLYLKVDLSKAPIIIITLLITIPLGVKSSGIGNVITSILSFFINAYMPGKLFGYGALKQLKDMIPVFLATGLMSLLVYGVVSITNSFLLQIVFGGITGLLFYWFFCHFIRLKELYEIYDILKNFRKTS
jgi:O-antigen/teichoic acid export membrane protein